MLRWTLIMILIALETYEFKVMEQPDNIGTVEGSHNMFYKRDQRKSDIVWFFQHTREFLSNETSMNSSITNSIKNSHITKEMHLNADGHVIT